MYLKIFTILFLLSLVCIKGFTQTPCGTLGQNPGTAFPVCGTDTFNQSTVPVCGGRQITAQGCSDFLSDINPFWYRFTCFTPGTLGFVITPNNLSDDYDWELFDITGHNPADVYTDNTLFVACNWSGETGLTGASLIGAGAHAQGRFVERALHPFSETPNPCEARGARIAKQCKPKGVPCIA